MVVRFLAAGGRRAALLAAVVLIRCGPSASADTVVYSNLDEANVRGFITQEPSGFDSGGLYTRLLADDITPIAGHAGKKINKIKFTIGNAGNTAVTSQLHVRLYESDGFFGGPGSLIFAFSGAQVTTPAGEVQLITFDSSSVFIPLPATTLWAGVTFSDGGGGATLAQLDGLGQDVISPPTIGTSADEFFITTDAGSFNGDDPDGFFADFGGNPEANFGWEFVVVPEPSGLAMACLGLLVGGAAWRTRRSISAGDAI
jgi:hypothetical protein